MSEISKYVNKTLKLVGSSLKYGDIVDVMYRETILSLKTDKMPYSIMQELKGFSGATVGDYCTWISVYKPTSFIVKGVDIDGLFDKESIKIGLEYITLENSPRSVFGTNISESEFNRELTSSEQIANSKINEWLDYHKDSLSEWDYYQSKPDKE